MSFSEKAAETDRREGGTGEGVGNACPVRAHAFAAAF